MLWVLDTAIEACARQQALSEFLSLIEGRDLLLTHADKQIRQLQQKLTEKQAIINFLFFVTSLIGRLTAELIWL